MNFRAVHSTKRFGCQKLEHGEKTKIILAALVHDLGHVSFSHSFESIFENLGIHDFSHETYSQKFLDRILDRVPHDFDYNSKEIDYLMTGHCQGALGDQLDRKGLYSIVSDHINGVDADRLDYLRRDCTSSQLSMNIDSCEIIGAMQFLGQYNGRGNHIGFSFEDIGKVNHFFDVRYRMYRTMYLSETEMGFELYMSDLIKTFEAYLKIRQMVRDLDGIVNLTDTYIHTVLSNVYAQRKALGLGVYEMDMIQRYREGRGYDFAGKLRVKINQNASKKEIKEKIALKQKQVVALAGKQTDSDQIVFDNFAKSPFKDSSYENIGMFHTLQNLIFYMHFQACRTLIRQIEPINIQIIMIIISSSGLCLYVLLLLYINYPICIMNYVYLFNTIWTSQTFEFVN